VEGEVVGVGGELNSGFSYITEASMSEPHACICVTLYIYYMGHLIGRVICTKLYFIVQYFACCWSNSYCISQNQLMYKRQLWEVQNVFLQIMCISHSGSSICNWIEYIISSGNWL